MSGKGEGTAGSAFWTIVLAFVGLLIGRWSTARARAAQDEALTAALERVSRLEAENDRLKDEAAQRADAALPPPLFPKTMIKVKLNSRKRRRRL
jgi:hypothetical protein